MDKYNSVVAKFDNYMTKKIHGILVIADKLSENIVIFPEYGLSEILPIYSGDLGFVRGSLPKQPVIWTSFTAVGLLYARFNQH